MDIKEIKTLLVEKLFFGKNTDNYIIHVQFFSKDTGMLLKTIVLEDK